jgi:hypothetical protein
MSSGRNMSGSGVGDISTSSMSVNPNIFDLEKKPKVCFDFTFACFTVYIV